MNKQELIKHFEDMPYVSVSQMGKKSFIDMIEKLDEPQKVTIPQFVADYIESEKDSECGLLGSMKDVPYEDNAELRKWFYKGGNVEVFARAWLDGYEVDKENRYRVKMKGMDKDFTMLKLDEIKGGWYLGSDTEFSYTKNTHTRKELEQAGFGWVFDCPGVEIEEVEG